MHGMVREGGRRFKREGTYVYLWLIHVDAWQKSIQYCKAIILQLKKYILKKRDRKTQRERQRHRDRGRGTEIDRDTETGIQKGLE